MVADVAAGIAILAGVLLLIMGVTGSYTLLNQFGIGVPAGAETTGPELGKSVGSSSSNIAPSYQLAPGAQSGSQGAIAL